MSKTKKTKINNLKKRRTAPRLILLFIMLILFATLDSLMLYLMVQNMVGNKILNAYKLAQRVAAVYESETSEYDLIRDMYGFRNLNEDISSICIVDKDNKVIEAFGNETPDMSKAEEILFSGCHFEMIPEDGADIFYRDGDEFSVRIGQCISSADIQSLFTTEVLDFNDMSKEWISFRCWFISPAGNDGIKVCINGTQTITHYEIYMQLMIFGFLLLVALLFCIYETIEITKVFADQKKAYLILHTDLVTGGNNRLMFEEAGSKLLKKKYNYAVIHLRLDKYRNYCMCNGDAQGEELLETIYEKTKAVLNKKELLAHIGSGNYSLLLKYEGENEINERIQSLFSELEGIDTNQKTTFSAGITKVTDKNIAVHMNEADIARSSVKEDSSIRIVWFNDAMKALQIWESKVENDMESALSKREFQVYLQPKYSTKKEVISGAEALVRWIHPTEGFVPPGKFIPIFEKNGFIIKLDDFMIEEVSRIQARWMKEGKQLIPISVNVSRAHFTKTNLADHIRDIVDKYNVPHEYIELELTESAFFDDKEILLSTVGMMKEYGFHVSMDDFGAGYSSLNSLKELPLDIVKLDAEFFRGSDDFDRANLIVSRTIKLAKQLGMTIVAEGIETREQVDFLAKEDCDLIQGFYFDKPMPVDDFENKAYKTESQDNTDTPE